MQLTKNFTLQELIRSNTAVTLGLDNSPPKSVIDNLKTLCERILQPLRDFFNVPITISSGYRCAALNKAVGGSSSSQHLTGEAADIQLPKTYGTLDGGWKLTDMEIARRRFSWLRDNTDFDQLIMETDNGRDFWIHVSTRKNHKKNRHQVIYYKKK